MVNVEVVDFELPTTTIETIITESNQQIETSKPKSEIKASGPKQHSVHNEPKTATKDATGSDKKHLSGASSNIQYTKNGDSRGYCELALKYYNGTDFYQKKWDIQSSLGFPKVF